MKLCRNKNSAKILQERDGVGKKQGKKEGEKEIQMMNLCLKKTFPLKRKEVFPEHIESLKHQRQMIKQWNDKNEMKRETTKKTN